MQTVWLNMYLLDIEIGYRYKRSKERMQRAWVQNHKTFLITQTEKGKTKREGKSSIALKVLPNHKTLKKKHSR